MSEPVRYIQADDGILFGVDADEDIVEARDPNTGEYLAVDLDDYDFTFEEPEPEPDPYEERIANLEQRMLEPSQPTPVGFELQYDQLDEARLTGDMLTQGAFIEQALDRRLTLDEKRRLGNEALSDVEAGDLRPDLVAALHRLGDIPDLDEGSRMQRHQARTDHMAALLADREREDAAARGEDDLTNEQRPAQRPDYDLDNHEQRAQYEHDRMRGVADPSMTYSSSDLEEAWE